MPFIAGYETHLIVDIVWANDENWMDESIYEHYNVNPNDPMQKFALYALVDDYFQAESDWFFSTTSIGNIMRANDMNIIQELGYSESESLAYKSAASIYLREPGIDTIIKLDFVPGKLDELLVRNILDQKTDLTKFLKEFKEISIEKCIAFLEKYI
ncbi:MAG: hypothetical protein Q7S21_06315 [archaeon]|nr:hypothetical protein [archaeon]